MKKQQLTTYEVYLKSPASEMLICRTTQKAAAKKAYGRCRNPRLRIDGTELPILEADKMMRSDFNRDGLGPKYKKPETRNIHQLKPAE